MRFPPEFLDEIRTRLPVSEVVGQRIKLRRQGREWRGLSPFNAEKTPSFFVNDGKMAWFDFSSGKNGNIFDFVMETEGLSFVEAVERLAGQAGLNMPQRTPESAEREQKRAGLHEVLEHAAKFFQTRLAGREGGRGRAYLKEREITAASQAEFRLGYAPGEKFALRDHLASVGATVETMCEAGLLVHGDDIKVPYDRFRDRVMFPICDRSGRVVAFGGRALDKDVPAKYLNSPETPLFHKGGLLFNHHRARKPASDKGTVVAVEGYVDVIALHAAGFPNAVAPLGTALTADQCDLLWRMAPEPILCFDGDGAGRRAAFRALDTALPLIAPDKTFRFAFLPEGQDPDDLVRTSGAAAMADVLGGAKPLVDVLWMRETESHVFATPEQRAGLERRLAELVRGIGDEALRRHYESLFRERARALFRPAEPGARQGRTVGFLTPGQSWAGRRGATPSLRGYLSTPLPPPSQSLSRTQPLTRSVMPQREALILASMLTHPALLERHFETVVALEFTNNEAARLRDAIVHLSGEALHDSGTLRHSLDAGGFTEVCKHIEQVAEKLPHWHFRCDASDSDADQILTQALTLHQKMQALDKDLREAERALARETNERNFALLRDVKARLSALNGMEAMVEGFGSASGRAGPEV